MCWQQHIVSPAPSIASMVDCKQMARRRNCEIRLLGEKWINANMTACFRKRIRLGEFNTETERDCMKFGRRKICADPIVEVGFDKIIVHANYSENSPQRYHDIALIRLDRDVKCTKYIRPICLPTNGHSSGIRAGNRLTVAGWGQTDICSSVSIRRSSPSCI